MNKLTCKLLPLFVISLLVFPVYAEEAAEDEFNDPSSPEELLELVQKGQFADTKEQRDRERQFRNEKNKQAKLLRVPKFAEIPYPAIMEPSLVIEYYSR